MNDWWGKSASQRMWKAQLKNSVICWIISSMKEWFNERTVQWMSDPVNSSVNEWNSPEPWPSCPTTLSMQEAANIACCTQSACVCVCVRQNWEDVSNTNVGMERHRDREIDVISFKTLMSFPLCPEASSEIDQLPLSLMLKWPDQRSCGVWRCAVSNGWGVWLTFSVMMRSTHSLPVSGRLHLSKILCFPPWGTEKQEN